MTAAESRYGLWLDRKGRVLGDSQVGRGPGDAFWVASVHSAASLIAGHLEAHRIADDVAFEDLTGAWAAIALIGPGVASWVRGEALAGLAFQGRRGVPGAWEWMFPAAEGPTAAELTGAAEVEFEELERMRIAAGVPRVPDDIGPADLPNEGGLDAEAISYSKGCYLGQEVMARLKSQGRVRRRLRRVGFDGQRPAAPAPLWAEGRRQGELRSCVLGASGSGGEGLALLPVSFGRGARLAFSDGGPAAVRVLDGPESV